MQLCISSQLKLINVAVIVPSLANKGPVRVVQGVINTSVKLALPIKFTLLYCDDIKELAFDCDCIQYNKHINLSAFNVVHTHGLRPDFIAFKQRKNIKYHISTIHNYVFDDLAYSYNRLISFMFGRLWVLFWRRADLLITISKSMESYYKNKLNFKKVKTIYNGIGRIAPANSTVEKSDIDTILSFREEGKTIIGVVCQLTKIKGIDQILLAVNDTPFLKLMVVGGGKELKSLIASAARLGIEDRCLFVGYRNEAFRYLQFVDVFAIPSRSEGFGITLLEAARFKIPTICSDIATFKELFTEEEVEFFELENIGSFIAGIKRLLKTREQKALSFYKKFINTYTDDLMATEYYDTYMGSLKE